MSTVKEPLVELPVEQFRKELADALLMLAITARDPVQRGVWTTSAATGIERARELVLKFKVTT